MAVSVYVESSIVRRYGPSIDVDLHKSSGRAVVFVSVDPLQHSDRMTDTCIVQFFSLISLLSVTVFVLVSVFNPSVNSSTLTYTFYGVGLRSTIVLRPFITIVRSLCIDLSTDLSHECVLVK